MHEKTVNEDGTGLHHSPPGVRRERLVYLRRTGEAQSTSVPLAAYRKKETQTTLYHPRIADGLALFHILISVTYEGVLYSI
jgi:hypothetical protein